MPHACVSMHVVLEVAEVVFRRGRDERDHGTLEAPHLNGTKARETANYLRSHPPASRSVATAAAARSRNNT